MKKIHQINNKAFTIVELLIVIVVIGILAGLVLNSFNNVQKTARNQLTISNTKNYINAITAYTADKGEYPLASLTGNRAACFGFYEDVGGSTRGDCRSLNSGTNFTSTLPQFDTEIAPYIGSTDSAVSAGAIVNYDQVWYGPFMIRSSVPTVDDVNNQHLVLFMLEGDGQDCKLPGIVSGLWPTYVSGSYIHSSDDSTSGITQCVIHLDLL